MRRPRDRAHSATATEDITDMAENARTLLHRLARAHGVQTRYTGQDGSEQSVGDETLIRVLAALGVGAPLLAACALLGVDEVWAMGGAQAVAGFAHGFEDTSSGETVVCAPVSLVTGPGNIYVAAAKRLLKGLIGIDAEAGPTEIGILADDTADAEHVAADLISQAEHDNLAASVLVTDSTRLADDVEAALERRARATKHSERVLTALGGPQSAIVLVDDVTAGLRVVDAYGAEHLEIHTASSREDALRVRNAGAIFVGTYSPVSLGDYAAGSNHVLPTGGCACHSSGLSVQSFLKGVHIVDYSRDALAEVADVVVTLANAEDLPAHGEAVTARFERRDEAEAGTENAPA